MSNTTRNMLIGGATVLVIFALLFGAGWIRISNPNTANAEVNPVVPAAPTAVVYPTADLSNIPTATPLAVAPVPTTAPAGNANPASGNPVVPNLAGIVPQPTAELLSAGVLPDTPVDASHGKWDIKFTTTAQQTDPIVAAWLSRLEDPNPSQWKYFPNIGNPDRKDFLSEKERPAPWGAEYGMDESPFCENHPCDIQVSAWHYRLITGDYSFMGHVCRAQGKSGCLLLLINVMDKSVTYKNQDVDNGFTVTGRYWDGDRLEWATLGLVSHASANMLGMQTFAHPGEILNSGNGDNAGANCGDPKACPGVDVTVLVWAGDRLLANAHTMVSR